MPKGANTLIIKELLKVIFVDLTAPQSEALNARLVLLLANHIGHLEVLQQALHAARASAGVTAP